MVQLSGTTYRRIGISMALAGLLVLAGVHYEAAESRKLEQPTATEIATEYDRYVGETTLLFGTVLDRGDDWLEIRVESDVGPFQMRVTAVPESVTVQRGGVVQVFGSLEDDRAITAKEVVVVNEGRSSLLYKYITSIAGVVLFLLAFFRYWTIDWITMQLRPTDHG